MSPICYSRLLQFEPFLGADGAAGERLYPDASALKPQASVLLMFDLWSELVRTISRLAQPQGGFLLI